MRLKNLISGIAICLGLALPVKAKAGNLILNADMQSRYAFMGFTYSERPVIQPYVSFTHNGITCAFFGSADVDGLKLKEADFSVSGEKNVGRATGFFGYGVLTFPNTGNRKTQEVFIGAYSDLPFNPNIRISYDFDEGSGVYGTLNAIADLRIASLSAGLGYNYGYFREGNGFSNADLCLSKSFSVKRVRITPHINCSIPLDNDFQRNIFTGLKLELQ